MRTKRKAQEKQRDRIPELLKALFGNEHLLTVEQVRELMYEHARASKGMRAAAREAGVSSTYWFSSYHGNQNPGDKLAKAYHLEPVIMYRIVKDQEEKNEVLHQ